MGIKNKILIIIPAHNEAANISRVISEAKETCPFADIVVMNDGSNDGTGEIAKQYGVKVIDICLWLGIGGTMQAGFIFACQNGYDIAVQLDADCQHNPAGIGDLIQPILDNDADVVIGSRFLTQEGYHSNFIHRLGILMISRTIYLVSGKRFTDPTSGFRAANKAAIAFYSQNYPRDYPEAEVIMLLLKRKFRIKEVPTVMRARLSGKSSIRKLHTVYYMVKVMLSILIASLGRSVKPEN